MTKPIAWREPGPFAAATWRVTFCRHDDNKLRGNRGSAVDRGRLRHVGDLCRHRHGIGALYARTHPPGADIAGGDMHPRGAVPLRPRDRRNRRQPPRRQAVAGRFRQSGAARRGRAAGHGPGAGGDRRARARRRSGAARGAGPCPRGAGAGLDHRAGGQRLSQQHASGGHLHTDHANTVRTARSFAEPDDDAAQLRGDPRRHDDADRLEHQSPGVGDAGGDGTSRLRVFRFHLARHRAGRHRPGLSRHHRASPDAVARFAYHGADRRRPSIHRPDQRRRGFKIRRAGATRRLFPATGGGYRPHPPARRTRLRAAFR